MKILGIVIVVTIVGILTAVWIGSHRWNRKTSILLSQLVRSSDVAERKTFTYKELEGLPAPVMRYFRLILKEGQPRIRSARILQQGEFCASESAPKWNPFKATEYFSTTPPGFIWDAGISMAPLMTAKVRDGYVGGKGFMQVKLLSLLTFVDAKNRIELNSGALQRYLAEAVWFPTALLPGQGVTWTAIDENKALATLNHASVSVSLEFHFNQIGEVTSIFTPGRYRELHEKYELTPWSGTFRNYVENGGIRIPIEGVVEWQSPRKTLPYWKGHLVDVHYEFLE